MAIQERRPPARCTGEPPDMGRLAANPLFASLPKPVLADLVSEAIHRTYRRGHHLFRAGDPALAVFFVESGLVALTELDERGSSAVALTFSPGQAFGQAATVLGACHPWTATAVVDTDVLLLPGYRFNDVYRRFPDLALQIIRGLCEMLFRAQQAAIRLTLAPANSRVAAFLLECASKAADSGADQPAFDLDLSHQDLALLLGTARETVTRILTGLTRAGVIATGGRRVCLLRPDVLRGLAESEPWHSVAAPLSSVTNVTAPW